MSFGKVLDRDEGRAGRERGKEKQDKHNIMYHSSLGPAGLKRLGQMKGGGEEDPPVSNMFRNYHFVPEKHSAK